MTRPKEKAHPWGNFVRRDAARDAPPAGLEMMGPSDHFVQFYETDSFLINSLTGFFGTGLDVGDSCVLVANSDHRESLEKRLIASGRDLALARETGQFLCIDDGELLDEFMVNGEPDPALFYKRIGQIIELAAARGTRVRVFGEMVARLWSEHKHAAAIQLEELWNGVAEKYPFSLYCGYPLRAFDAESHTEPLFHICSGHTRVIPGESYTSLYEAEDRLRTIVMLQQKAARLEAEVAERKQALVREQLARAEAEKANRLKDQFLSTVSHELRTPLNVIIGWSTMLRDGKLNAVAQQRAVHTIENNARQQSRLIDDILDVARAMSGRISLNIHAVELAPIIDESIRSLQFAADSKEIKIDFEAPDGEMVLSADPDRLRQILWNLLSNAVKFSPQKGNIKVELAATENSVKITVSDNGRGIDPEFLPYIFDQFRQADGSRTRDKGGLGLGLSIVRYLVELHGGHITAESAGKGQGATFAVALPVTG